MKRIVRIELSRENFKFSSGHFTIFSATERENIHGHNFNVHLVFDAMVEENGMTFDYMLAKRFMETLCKSLNEIFLLPERSAHLKIEEKDGYVWVTFNGEKIPFLTRDVKILPIENTTLEDLSDYLLKAFIKEFVEKQRFPLSYAEVKVFSAPGQSAGTRWKAQS